MLLNMQSCYHVTKILFKNQHNEDRWISPVYMKKIFLRQML